MSEDIDKVEKLLLDVSGELFKHAECVFVVIARYPTHDDSIGRVQFVRRGNGPAYALAIRTLLSEIDLTESQVDELSPEDDEDDD